MRPPARNIINLTRSLCTEGPLIRRTPIGQIEEGGLAASRRFSAFTSPCSKSNVRLKSRQCEIQPAVKLHRVGYGIRFQSTQHEFPGGSRGSPKRSDTKPLLGALFGATALAFVGTSLVTRDSVEETENPIKSDDDVDITDTDGKLSIRPKRASLWNCDRALCISKPKLMKWTRCSKNQTCRST